MPGDEKPEAKPAKFYTVGRHKKTGIPRYSGFLIFRAD
jgi:hypothetical protein